MSIERAADSSNNRGEGRRRGLVGVCDVNDLVDFVGRRLLTVLAIALVCLMSKSTLDFGTNAAEGDGERAGWENVRDRLRRYDSDDPRGDKGKTGANPSSASSGRG